MELPQELVEEIISYIPPDDHQSLLNYSLVAKSWVYPSRRRIFKTVDIWSDRCLNLWLAAISPTNVGVLQHVRSLTCKIASTPDSLRPSVDPLRDYLPSFRQLERLSFFSGFVPSLTQISAYSPFQHTLSYLFLRCFDVTASAVVTVVNYFPNLAHLEVGELSNVADDQPVLPFSRPLQKLTITNLNTIDGVVFLDQLMGLRPRCDEVTIGTYESSCRSSLAQCIINGVEASVKRLNLRSIIPYPEDHLTLSSCRELRELEIHASRPGTSELDLISSITSTNIRRITFTRRLSLEQPVPNWTRLDNSLCQLVDRSKCGPQLEVEFRAPDARKWWSGEQGFKKYLPRFYEKSEAGFGEGGDLTWRGGRGLSVI